MKTRKQVADKIISLLSTHESPPDSMFSMGIFFARVLDDEDWTVVNELEKTKGEEKANEWLCEVLAATGLYSIDEDGLAELDKAS